MVFDDESDRYEPSWDEIEALLAAEQTFREEHDLLDDDAWNVYCIARAEDWLADQADKPGLAPPHERARAFILEDIRLHAGIGPPSDGDRHDSPEGLKDRWPYDLTPIEAQFYDALAETGLTFSVQPWLQHADRKYRADFLIHYDGRAVVVELDGHDWHKTKDQRGKDAAKDRWLQARGIRVVRFTGSQVYADTQGCVRELLDVVRQSQARP